MTRIKGPGLLGAIAAMLIWSGAAWSAERPQPLNAVPDFSGRDRGYANFRTRILQGMREGPDFSGHYKIIRIGCGTGCTINVMADLRSGKISTVPYGGEPQYTLRLAYGPRGNAITAKWISGDFCLSQVARWNGSAFTVDAPPSPEPDGECRE